MATKRQYEKWGKFFAIFGGIFFIVGAVILLMDMILDSFTVHQVITQTIVRSNYFVQTEIILVIVGFVLGVLSLIIPNTELGNFIKGLLLLVFGIAGLGLSGLFVFIGGMLFIIASMKKNNR